MNIVDSRPDRPAPPQQTVARRPWQAPTLTLAGTVADLVQVPKLSGSQDCGAQKRQNEEGTGTCPL